MPLTSPEALSRALASGKRGGVFFLFGDDEFLKDEALDALVRAHLDPTTRDFNFDQLRATDTPPEAVASILATPPMMAEWRVVVLREAQALATAARARDVVESVLQKPPAGLALILVATLSEKAKAQLWERLKKQATSVEFAGLAVGDLPGWLVTRARSDGYELELKASRALAAAVGTELGILMQELRKLYDYVQARTTITVDDVHAAVGGIPRQNRWEWFDMLGERRFREARASLPILLDSGESGVGLVIGLGTHFLRLGILAAGGQRALEQALPAHQRWLAGRLAGQSRHWRTPELEDALADLLRADRLLKSSSLGDLPVLEEFILRLQTRANEN